MQKVTMSDGKALDVWHVEALGEALFGAA